MSSSKNVCDSPKQRQPNKKLESLKDLQSKRQEEPFKQSQNITHEFLCFIPYESQKPKVFVFEDNVQGILQIFADQLIQLIMKEFKTNQTASNDKDQPKLSEVIFQLVQKPEFQLMIPQKDSPLTACSQEALKDIILQFIIQVGNHSLTETANSLIRKYPLIISIFVCVLRQLLVLGDICQNYNDELNMEQTYDFLASYFGIDIFIDIQNNSSYFPQLGTYVLQRTSSLIYMVRTDNYETDKKRRISLVSNQQNQNEDYSQIDVQQFSNILNSKQSGDINGEDNQINVVVSNIDIGGEQIRQINQVQSTYKIAESQIIINHFQVQQHEEQEKRIKQNKEKQESQCKGSITTTLSSFRKKSSNLCKNTIKDYLQSQSVLKSELFDTKNYHKVFAQRKQNKHVNNFNVNVNSNLNGYENQLFKDYGLQKQNQQCFLKPENAKSEVKFVRNQKQNKNQQKQDSFKQFYDYTSETFYGPTFSNGFTNKQTQKSDIFFTPKFKSPQISNCAQQLMKPKGIVPWINQNITKQFTSSFILMRMPEPFKSNIQSKKARARLQRRNIYNSLNFFA